MGLITPLLQAIKTAGYTTATAIQQEAIPVALQEKDILGCAQTGTGKTAAFAIPILQLLSREKAKGPRHIRALVLTPTRELAVQIGESFTAYGRHTALKQQVIFGGVPQHTQVNAIREGVDILVATPGRLLDLVQQGHIQLSQLKLFVLDEADRMLDMGFINDVKNHQAAATAKANLVFLGHHAAAHTGTCQFVVEAAREDRGNARLVNRREDRPTDVYGGQER